MKTANSSAVRWQIPWVLLITLVIAYFDRLNITYALPKMAVDFGWKTAEIGEKGGLLMSIFFVAYGLANIFISPWAYRWGIKKSLLLIVILWSVFTALGAILSQSFEWFIFSRICLGISEGVHFPMMSTLTKNWFPAHERSRANGLWIAGIFISVITGPVLLVPIIDILGWQNMFLVLSGLGLVITLPFIYFFIYDSPELHPHISAQEIAYLSENNNRENSPTPPQLSDYQIYTQVSFLLALITGICNNLVAYGLLSWLPTYFTEERNLPFKELTYAVSLPYVCSLLGIWLWASLGDYFNKRTVLGGIGFMMAGIFTLFAMQANTIPLTISILSLAVFSISAYTTAEYAIIQRILPLNRIATGVGIYNGLTILVGGGLGPVIVGGIVSYTGSYAIGIIALSAFSILAGVIQLVLSRVLRY
jgi:MFS family permease